MQKVQATRIDQGSVPNLLPTLEIYNLRHM